jgi:hypothetical protein
MVGQFIVSHKRSQLSKLQSAVHFCWSTAILKVALFRHTEDSQWVEQPRGTRVHQACQPETLKQSERADSNHGHCIGCAIRGRISRHAKQGSGLGVMGL